MLNKIIDLLKAPEPIAVAAPPAPPKDKRIHVKDNSLTRLQQYNKESIGDLYG